jgi:hypothetical protein
MCVQGLLLHKSGKAWMAAQLLNNGIAHWRSTGASFFTPTQLSWLSAAYAELVQFDDARRCIGEAMTAVYSA